MKTPLLTSIAAICLLTAVSCTKHSETETPKNTTTTPAEPHSHLLRSSVRVPLAVAQVNVKRYNDMCAKALSKVPIKAYTIHAGDLMEVLGIPDTVACKYKYARAYLGLDSLNEFKLYFTPVDGADLEATPKVAGKDVILKDDKGVSYVLDLNAPCPMTCDVTSPLFFLGTPHE